MTSMKLLHVSEQDCQSQGSFHIKAIEDENANLGIDSSSLE